MITTCRADERYRGPHRELDGWSTFAGKMSNGPQGAGFGALVRFDEYRLPPGVRVPPTERCDAEIVTYVREGTLAFEDSHGRSGIIQTGEFERMITEDSVRHSEANPSESEWGHVFQMWLHHSGTGYAPVREQERFSVAQRRGVLCVIASPDARKGSLRLQIDVVIYSSILYSGQHVVHELGQGRSAWLHVVLGEATLGDLILSTGDGAGIAVERAVSLTAQRATEILLIDLPVPPERSTSTHPRVSVFARNLH